MSEEAYNPTYAALLNLLLPGAGFIYLGNSVRGFANIVAMGLGYLVSWRLAWASLSKGFHPVSLTCFAVFAMMPLIYHGCIVLEAYRAARRLNRSDDK